MQEFLSFPHFLFFSGVYTILKNASILPMSQLETQQVMTSQIRSHIEYLRQTYIIFLLILHMTVFSMI